MVAVEALIFVAVITLQAYIALSKWTRPKVFLIVIIKNVNDEKCMFIFHVWCDGTIKYLHTEDEIDTYMGWKVHGLIGRITHIIMFK